MLQSLFRPVLRPIMMGVMSVTGSRRAWSPANLYLSGEAGAWYDPSDLSTMFNDSAGTTPVATPGTVADSSNPVGLIQDKSGGGHHASQSTSTARPLLSARKNSLTHTSQLEDVWTGISATLSGEAAIAPDGSLTATKITETTADGAHGANLFNLQMGLVGNATRSIYIKAAGRRYLYLLETYCGYQGYFDCVAGVLRNYSAATFDITDAGNGWWRFTAAYTITFTYINLQIFLNRTDTFIAGTYDSYVGDGVSGIYIWGDQLEYGTTATTYQRVTTDSDYDGDPAKFPYKEQFDGVDDFQVTASGGGASTAAMVCLGFISTLAGTAQTLWTDRTGNTGLSLGISAGNAIVLSGGNGSSIVTVTGDAVTLGTPYVVTALYDGTDLSVQLNDATPVTGACTLSAGQAAITLGAATGGASGFFKGSIFEVLYVKDATTLPADVAEAKAWVAAKSGVTL